MDVNMKTVESKKSFSCRWDGNNSPRNSKWLAENMEVMDQKVKQMLKVIEKDDESFANDGQPSNSKPELTAHVEEFYSIYQSLAESYNHLMGNLCKSAPSEFQMQDSVASVCGSDQSSQLVTPNQKLGMNNFGYQAASMSSGNGSSDIFLKDGNESSSSSSDSESESFSSSLNGYFTPMNISGKGLHQQTIEAGTKLPSMKEMLHVTEEDNANSVVKEGECENYKELLRKLRKYEEELMASNLKLKISEEENSRLKSEIEKSNSFAHAENVHNQLESARRAIKMREADLESEKSRVLELQNRIAELEIHVLDSNSKIELLMEELEKSRERLKQSDKEIMNLKTEFEKEISESTQQVQGQLKLALEDIAQLKDKLDSEKTVVVNLQERIIKYEAELSERDHELGELNAALDAAQESFSSEKAQMQSDMFSLSEKHNQLEAKIMELKQLIRLAEERMWQSEAERMKLVRLHDVEENELQCQINQLEANLAEKGEHVQTLNKVFDGLKLKYDTLMAEKDGMSAKVNTLRADVSSRDDKIREMEDHLSQLHRQHADVVAGSESAWKLVDELRLKVEELEKEVDRQRIVILDSAEEKREVIRQLCFSLEHYRSGYKELHQAFHGRKAHAVLAA